MAAEGPQERKSRLHWTFFGRPRVRTRNTVVCIRRAGNLCLTMRKSFKKLVQTAWGDGRPMAVDCALLVLLAVLGCLTIITAIGQWTAIHYVQ